MKILRHVALRILLALPAVWLIITMVFLLAHIVPGDPVQQMLGEGARAEDLTQLRHALGLDLPLPVQYEHYLTGVLRGNLGESFRYQRPVTKVILEHYPATLELASVALLVCALIGISAGHPSRPQTRPTSRPRRKRPNSLRPKRPQFRARPNPDVSFRRNSRVATSLRTRRHSHIILPAITLGAALAAILTRMVRSSMIEELSSDYVRTARAKGLSESAVLFRHAFRNALIPILTILGLQFGTLLAGTIVTESIFSWPGIGGLAVTAIQARDYPLLQGCILLIAISYVVVNLLTDFVYVLVDPRVRFE